MIEYLLDTSICIELIRRRSATMLSRLHGCELGTVGLSAISLAELRYGVSRSRDPAANLAALAMFCVPLEVAPFGDRAAEHYGEVRTKLESVGTPIGSLDMLIGAHALALSATLVTANEREFRRIEGLEIENWRMR